MAGFGKFKLTFCVRRRSALRGVVLYGAKGVLVARRRQLKLVHGQAMKVTAVLFSALLLPGVFKAGCVAEGK